MSGTTTWITDTVAELKLRQAQIINPQASVTMPVPNNTVPLTVPKGSGKQRTVWGKKLAAMTFGSHNDRHGNHNRNTPEGQEQAARLAAARQTIDEQITLGTAAAVTAPSSGGRQLSGNFFSAEGHNLRTDPQHAPDTTRPVVLFLSGSGGTAEEYGTNIAEFYQESGASMLAVNYGGYGGSTGGAPTEQSLLEDGQAMLKYLLDLGYTEDQIIIHGFSMGGAVAGVLQAHNEKQGMQLRGLMLDRPMVSVSGGVEAHGRDAVDEMTGNAVLRGMGRPVVKIASAFTRASTGSMSARKALTKNHSDTRVIVSGDEGRFAAQGDALRTKLQTRDPGRSVTGAASGVGHLKSDEMIAQNNTFMQAMIDTPPGATGPQVRFASGLSDVEKKSTRKLRERVATRVKDIETDVMRAEDEAGRVTVAINTSPKPLSSGAVGYVTARIPQIRNNVAQGFADVNEFAGILDATLDPITSNRIGTLRRRLRLLEKNLNAAAEAAGRAAVYGADAVAAEIDHAADMLGRYNAIPTPARTGNSFPEQELVASNVLFGKMSAAGVAFAGNDAQIVRDVRDAAGDIQMAIARARQPPPQPRVPVTRTNSGTALAQRRGRAKLTASLS